MPRILLIDDDADFHFLVKTVLGRRGYEVIWAETGSIALGMINEEQPDADGHTGCGAIHDR